MADNKFDNQSDLPQTEVGLFDFNKPKSLKLIVAGIKEGITEGKIPAAQAGLALKRMVKSCEEILKDKNVKETIEDDTRKYMENGKIAKFHDAEIHFTATYTKYDCSECGHPELDALYDIQKQLKIRIKQIEDELKLMAKAKDEHAALKNAAKNQGGFNFGIDGSTKEIIVKSTPKLVFEDSGEVATVKYPKKIQTLGLKYMKI